MSEKSHLTSGFDSGIKVPQTHPSIDNTIDEDILVTAPGQLRVIRRNGKITHYDENKIAVAMTKAFIAVEGGIAAASNRIHDMVSQLTKTITQTFSRRMPEGGTIHIEDIQDQVELALMRAGQQKVARSYVLYREERRKIREQQQQTPDVKTSGIQVLMESGHRIPLEAIPFATIIHQACTNVADVNALAIIEDTERNLFDGVPINDLHKAMIMSARTLIETEPNYSFVAARLLLSELQRQALQFLDLSADGTLEDLKTMYPTALKTYLEKAVQLELLEPKLLQFDLDTLGEALCAERDQQFTYLGLQTLYDRYFIHYHGTRFELPQVFFMRVAMGLAVNEVEKEARAIDFYNILSTFDFMSSTPTLFNSGTLRPQLSSCYLTTVPDDLAGIYNAIRDNALLSKYAGGLGNDWTPVRAMGAHIKGTNGKSQGTVPFMKVANDTAVAVNQCFAPNTPIFTADGVKAIKDVTTHDLVLSQSGIYRNVRETMMYEQTDKMVEIDIKHTIAPLAVTAGHPLWAISDVPMEQAGARTLNNLKSGKVNAKWIEAGNLKKGDYIAQVIPTEIVPIANFTPDDARFYGIMLGDGHISADGNEFGVSGNLSKDEHMQFVKSYLEERNIHYLETHRGETYAQIHGAMSRGVVREATTGQLAHQGEPTIMFSRDDLYDSNGKKYIARKYSHLPREHTLKLIQGLVETDGGISRGEEIYFTNISYPLVESLRYQLLRLGIPCAGQYREREQEHRGTRSSGEVIQFNGITEAYELRIPAIADIASLVKCKPLTEYNWITWNGAIFTRILDVKEVTPTTTVHDLKIDGESNYMTVSGLAHNGGKRKGAVCGYLETWHLDIEEFLELRKNTGDERRRTHDMNTANWIPDLFMKRVLEDKEWTLFSPEEVPDLHDLYGQDFEQAYTNYEIKAKQGIIKNSKSLSAVKLWRKMLGMLFETGHPWITFKDVCNLRSPQQHIGVVHSSNLCTEITLNTSADEIAVCNLGSINLAQHMSANGLDKDKLKKTIYTAIRMLDNVIDINFYSVIQARRSNLRHRPIGLGIMGFQDALYMQHISYSSDEAVDFADRSMEIISYYAIEASTYLAEERGPYSTFEGSLWSKGILPIDSINLLAETRGLYLNQNRNMTQDWAALRKRVTTVGMRNSNVLAIAPTATISNISGVSQSIEPTYQNLFVKSNLSGEFTVINPYLVKELKARNLWDSVMVNDLKYFDGSVQNIDRIPDDLKQQFATAFEVEPSWLVESASRRQKWIDQAQSLNLYMREPSGKKLDSLYRLAWLSGLKTTYYLRSLGATNVEKSTINDSTLNAVAQAAAPKVCSIADPDCEACQ